MKKKDIDSKFFYENLNFTQTVPTVVHSLQMKPITLFWKYKVNDSLERVNLLLCYLENTKPVTFLNKGSYVATIFEDDCNFGKERAMIKIKLPSLDGGQATWRKFLWRLHNKQENCGTKKSGNRNLFQQLKLMQVLLQWKDKVWIQSCKRWFEQVTRMGHRVYSWCWRLVVGDGLPFDATVYLKYHHPNFQSNRMQQYSYDKINYELFFVC